MFLEYAERELNEMKRLIDNINREDLAAFVETFHQAHARGARVFICGNGGSASTANHWACDLGKGASVEGMPRFKVLSLCEAVPTMTAIANDLSYEDIFVEQLKNLFEPGDVVVGISCSGNSENVVRAIRYARENGGHTAALLAFGGGKLKGMVDVALVEESDNYGLTETLHLLIEHIISFSFKHRFEAERGQG